MATSTPTAPVFPYTGDALSTVQVDFIGYFGRAAAATGANFWESQLLSGGSTQAAQVGIAAGFSVQSEATTLYPFLASPLVSTPASINSFVNAVFMNLFGHPQATGAHFWPDQLTATLNAAAALSGVAQTNFIANAVGQFIFDIALGAQAADQAVLTAKVTVANNFTLADQTAGVATPVGSPAWTEAHSVVSGVTSASQVAAAEAAITAFFATAGAPTFTLTAGTDTATTGFSTGTGATALAAGTIFNAPLQLSSSTLLQVQTVTLGDVVTDTATAADGTLNATFNKGVQTPSFTMSGVKTANLTADTGSGTDGFFGNVTGLQVVNNNGSLNFIQLGTGGNGLNTALTNYNSNASVQGFAGIIAASALSGTTDPIAIGLTGNLGAAASGTAPPSTIGGTSVKLIFAPDSGANGYETWTITSNGSEFLRLGQGTGTTNGDFGSGFGSASKIVLLGAGSTELNALNAGDFAALKTIDASAATGNVTLTGTQANVTGGYYSSVGVTAGNKSGFGLLTSGANIIAPTAILGGKGTDFVDLGGLTAPNINAMTTINVATGNTSTTNTLILPDTVVTQTAALAGESGFQIIGDANLSGGTINMANFAGSNELKLYGTETAGAETIKGGTNPFTLDLSGDTGGGANAWTLTGPGATTDAFTMIMGNTAHVNGTGGGGNVTAQTSVGDTIGALVVTGYEVVTIKATGGADTIGAITLNPSTGGGESLTVTGTQALTAGLVTLTGSGVLTDTDTGVFSFAGTTAGQIAGGSSGGIFMRGFDTSGTGVVEVGSTSKPNHLVGSVLVDSITGGSAGDTIAPGGGTNTAAGATFGDVVNLGTAGTTDNVDLFGTTGGFTAPNYTGGANTITASGDIAQPGWFGVTAATAIATLAANTGTSISAVQINTFTAGTTASGGDVIDISVGAWNNTAPFFGLWSASLTAQPTIGADAVISAPIGAGGTVATADVLLLAGQFASAQQVVTALHTTNTINLGNPLGVGNTIHILVLYNDTGNNAHLMDLDLLAPATTANTGSMTEHGSDMAVLVGVNALNLVSNNIHFLA